MKKFLLTVFLSAFMITNVFAGNNNIKLNDSFINLETPVKIKEGRSYVPLRELGEKVLGAEVKWDGTTKSAILTKNGTTVIVPLGSDTISVNSKEVPIDSPAFSEDGKSYVPVRAIAEGFGYEVGYSDGTITISNSSLIQFSDVKEGETLAIIYTDLGDIIIRFFPQYAPKAVENFIGLAKQGYYNGVSFHRVINGFMIQGGDPTATGAGGNSIWRRPFENEVCRELRNFRGALAMANAGENTNTSQFYIVQNNKLDKNVEIAAKNQLEQQKNTDNKNLPFPNEVLEKYIEIGGAPHLDFGYTVFGQVIEGMEVVDKIAEVETDANDKPINDIVMNRVDIIEKN
ncbi:MAG: peptidylprolyl isomerase [Lachnospirales bacterium]